jgi:WD40 repeat protein
VPVAEPAEAAAVTCSQDGTVRIWAVPSGAPLQYLRGHGSWVRCCEWSPRGDLIVSTYVLHMPCTRAAHSKYRAAPSMRQPLVTRSVIPAASMCVHGRACVAYLDLPGLAWVGGFAAVVCRSGDRRIGVWRVEASPGTVPPSGPEGPGGDTPGTFHLAALLRTHAHIVWQCCFSPDGSRFATVRAASVPRDDRPPYSPRLSLRHRVLS